MEQRALSTKHIDGAAKTSRDLSSIHLTNG